MKSGICIAALSLFIGVGIAQQGAGQSSPQTQSGQTGQMGGTSQTGQMGQTGQPGQAGQMSTKDQNAAKGSAAGQPAEMKTKTYKGVLVDATCAMGQSGATTGMTSSNTEANTGANTSANRSNEATETAGAGSSATAGNTNNVTDSTTGAANTNKKMKKDKSGMAERGGTQAQACPVTSSTTQVGLRTADGRTLRFDLVGNQRALDQLKNNKKWNQEMTSGKEVHAKISGAESGDKLIVSSIH